MHKQPLYKVTIDYSLNLFLLIANSRMDTYKKYIIVALLYCLPSFVFAQQTFTIKGTLYKKETDDRIAQVVITDLKSQLMMMSDELGGFSIAVAKGDTLLFIKNGFSEQKEVINNTNDIIIYLQPVLKLAEVTIKDKSTQQELNDAINTYRSKGLYFDGKTPFWSFINSPLTGLYEMFGKDATNERHFIAFSKDEMESIAVSKRYTPQLVKQVTLLPDTEVVKFMQQYTPSYEDIKEWNDYELITHIKKYFQYYKSNKQAIPMQKLY